MTPRGAGEEASGSESRIWSIEAEQDQSGSSGLARQGAEEVSPEVSRFVGTVLGAPSFEVGELIAEEFRAFRFKRHIRHVTRAMKQLDDAGMDARQVPMRTLAPLLEGGSLEDDDELSDRWAALLANAASDKARVPPSFPHVLREIEPVEARMLMSFTS